MSVIVSSRLERLCRVTAKVEVEVWTEHSEDLHPGHALGNAPVVRRTPRRECRKLEVSLSEQLDSSKDIREAFGRLAEIAVQGATR